MKGRELTKWRKRQFLSQQNLAELLSVHPNTIANWERGRTAKVPGSVELALEAIAQERASLVRKLNIAKADIAAQRRIKFAEQHPEHYLKLTENARKARAQRAANVAARAG